MKGVSLIQYCYHNCVYLLYVCVLRHWHQCVLHGGDEPC